MKLTDILDELAEKFAINLDSTLVSNPEYNKVSLQLEELYEKKFSKEQASELDVIIGKLSSVDWLLINNNNLQTDYNILQTSYNQLQQQIWYATGKQ